MITVILNLQQILIKGMFHSMKYTSTCVLYIYTNITIIFTIVIVDTMQLVENNIIFSYFEPVRLKFILFLLKIDF